MSIEALEIIEKLKKLDSKSQAYVAKTIINERIVDIGSLLVLYITNLQRERDNIARDVVRVAEAGATLSENKLRRVTGIGGRSFKIDDVLELALVRCLLEAGAHYGSLYGDQLRAGIDVKGMDEKWYEQCWKPQGKVYPIKEANHDH